MTGIVQRGEHLVAASHAKGLAVRAGHPAARGVVHLRVREERVFHNALLLALGGHHVHGVVQHGLAYLRGAQGHHNLRRGILVLQAGQRADVVQVRMGDENDIRVCGADEPVVRLAVVSLLLGVHAAIQHHAHAVQIQQVAVGADFGSARETGEGYHGLLARHCAATSPICQWNCMVNEKNGRESRRFVIAMGAELWYDFRDI